MTIHFLNAVLRFPRPIVDVLHLNPFVFQEYEADKLAILDILAEDESGRRFNIEVQRTNPGWLSERLTYYAATQLVEQIGEGDGSFASAFYWDLHPEGQVFPATRCVPS